MPRRRLGVRRGSVRSSGDLLDGIDLQDSAGAAEIGLQLAEDLQDRVQRERETAQALRDYLAALSASTARSPQPQRRHS